jgi:hypothetical protein
VVAALGLTIAAYDPDKRQGERGITVLTVIVFNILIKPVMVRR